ncbi:MAG: acyltransferase family protein [Proteus mirabilis]|nr:acyltransferase family protein [Proteus mirabilis]
MQKKTFREDINGLRAIAVLSVVIFHFNKDYLPGGFIGVDIFFVISGFLMTGIIFRGIENNNFSIVRFYSNRANRIIPALAMLCLVLMIFGWLYLTPLGYKELSKQVFSSITFISNFVYSMQSGYFDASSSENWLLHTWSLSVEWQFYIIYPVLLLSLSKVLSLRTIKILLIASTVFSFLFCIYATNRWTNPSYFLLPTRSWEMLIGGIAYIYPIKSKNNKLIRNLGLLIIILSFIFISESILWPGYIAIIPTIGVYLVISANNPQSRIMNNKVAYYIGLWSYSIYLWHWPIVVFCNYFGFSNFYMGVISSIIIGCISYYLIEKIKINQINFNSLKSFLSYKPLMIFTVMTAMPAVIYIDNGVKFRVNDLVINAESAINDKNKFTKECFYSPMDPYDAKPCIIGNKENISVIIVGDSHAEAISPAVINAYDLNNDGVVMYLRYSCPFILGVNNTLYSKYNCSEANKKNLDEIKEKYPNIPIVVINRTPVYIYGQTEKSRKTKNNAPSAYFSKRYNQVTSDLLYEFTEHYVDTICELTKSNPVYITTTTPEMPVNVPREIAIRSLRSNKQENIVMPVSDYKERNKYTTELLDATHKRCGANILDTSKYLCDSNYCIGSIDGNPLYYDGDHMSAKGSEILTSLFEKLH